MGDGSESPSESRRPRPYWRVGVASGRGGGLIRRGAGYEPHRPQSSAAWSSPACPPAPPVSVPWLRPGPGGLAVMVAGPGERGWALTAAPRCPRARPRREPSSPARGGRAAGGSEPRSVRPSWSCWSAPSRRSRTPASPCGSSSPASPTSPSPGSR